MIATFGSLLFQQIHSKLLLSILQLFVLEAASSNANVEIAGREVREPGASINFRQDDFLQGDAFRDGLAQVVRFNSSGDNLRSILRGLEQRYAVAIFLDRRVDPDQIIEVAGEAQSLESLIFELAEAAGGGALVLDNMIYVGPRRAVAELPFELEATEQSVREITDVGLRGRWTSRQSIRWDRLAEPRQLAVELTEEYSLDRHSALNLPHDLWAAGQLPPLPLYTRIAVLAAGFDLAVTVGSDGQRFKLARRRLNDPYELFYPAANARTLKNEIAKLLPKAEVVIRGSSLGVTAGWKQHYQLRRWLVVQRSKQLVAIAQENPLSEKRVSLENTEAQIGSILTTIAKQLEVKLELRVSANGMEKLTKLIRIDVANVTYEELIEKCLHGTGFGYQLNSTQLLITDE